MRIGVVADIHSNYEAFKAVLDHMPEVDRILCAGDLVGYGVHPNPVVDEIRERGNTFTCVKGNHDEAVVTYEDLDSFNSLARQGITNNRDVLSQKNLEFLSELQEAWRQILDEREIYMVHGSPSRPLKQYVRRGDVDRKFLDENFDTVPDAVVMGHTHQPYVKQVADTLVLNPGSVGQPRDNDHRASYALLETEDLRGEIYRVAYDVESVAQEIREEISPLLGDRLEKGM